MLSHFLFGGLGQSLSTCCYFAALCCSGGITSTAAVVALLWIEQADLLVGKIVRFFFSRVTNLSTDGSAQGRYGGIDVFFDDPARHWVVWFGRGINNDYEQFGSAGFTFLLNSFGIIGSLALAVCIVFLSRRIRISLLLLIGLILTAAPIFTNVAWLSAIALMMQRSGRSVGSPISVHSSRFPEGQARSTPRAQRLRLTQPSCSRVRHKYRQSPARNSASLSGREPHSNDRRRCLEA